MDFLPDSFYCELLNDSLDITKRMKLILIIENFEFLIS